MELGRVWYGAKYSHGVWERFAHVFGKSFFSLKSRSVNYFFCHPALAFWGVCHCHLLAICVPREISKLWKNGLSAILKKCPYFRLFWRPISDYFGKTGCFFKIFEKDAIPTAPPPPGAVPPPTAPDGGRGGEDGVFFKLFLKKHPVFPNIRKSPVIFQIILKKHSVFLNIRKSPVIFQTILKKHPVFQNSRKNAKVIFQTIWKKHANFPNIRKKYTAFQNIRKLSKVVFQIFRKNTPIFSKYPEIGQGHFSNISEINTQISR